jgi:hypothetical protein
MQPGDLRKETISAMADLHGFQSNVPATLLLIEPAEKQIHAAMPFLVGMVFRGTATRALALVQAGILHR